MSANIKWFGHDTFKIEGRNISIYTDPFKLSIRDRADIVLVSHSHYDHCSPTDIEMIMKKNTVLITTNDCAPNLKGDVRSLKPGDSITVNSVEVKAVSAYNINKTFHPKSNNWLGFIFIIDGVKYYFTGDTDFIPEMKNLVNENIDVAFIPVSGTFVMDVNEAVKATLVIKPKIAIPMHYGSIVGSDKDAKSYAEKLKGKIEIKILGKGKSFTLN